MSAPRNMTKEPQTDSFWHSKKAGIGLVAGVLLVVIGGVMAIVGGFVSYTVHDAIRWERISGEELGNMTSNVTTFSAVAFPPIDKDNNVQTLKVYYNTNCASGSCYSGATPVTTETCGAAPCYSVTEATGILVVNLTAAGVNGSENVVTTDYAGVKSGSDISNVYDKIMKALLILGVAMIVAGAAVILRALMDLG